VSTKSGSILAYGLRDVVVCVGVIWKEWLFCHIVEAHCEEGLSGLKNCMVWVGETFSKSLKAELDRWGKEEGGALGLWIISGGSILS